MALKTSQGGSKYFKVYKDADVGIDFSKWPGRTIVDSHMDDDVESDQEVLNNGKQTCYRDLLDVKTAQRQPGVRQRLMTFRMWSPMFGGTMPRRARRHA